MARLVLGSRMLLVAAYVGGCGGDPGSLVDTSNGSETSVGESSDSGSSGIVDPSGSSSSDDGSSDDESSSSEGGTTSTASARFIVRARKGEGELYDPELVVYEDGVLGDPVALAEVPGASAVLGASLGVTGQRVHYCTTDVAAADAGCFVRGIDGSLFGAAQPIGVGLLAPPTVITAAPQPAAAAGYVTRAAPMGALDLPAIFFTPVQDDVLASPQLLASSDAEQRIASIPLISPDGQWVVYGATGPGAAVRSLAVSTNAAEPNAIELGEALAFVQWLPDSSAIVYGVDQDTVDGAKALYLQPIAIDAPPALRLDAPDDPRSKGSITIAPDGHALTYVATDGVDGSLLFVALDGGVPEAPVVVHDEHTLAFWSPDSRRLAFFARDVSGAPDYVVLDAADSTPEPGFTLREAMPGAVPRLARFMPEQRQMFVLANEYASGQELFRIDISGDGPGEPQRVSAALPEGTDVAVDYVVAANGSRVIYRADTDGAGVYELFAVDTSGAVPAEAVRIDVPLREGTTVRGIQLSANGSVATYHEVDHGEPWMLNMVDLEQPGAPILLSRDAMGVLFVDE